MTARFDDLARGGALEFGNGEVLVTWSPGEVRPLLAEADRALAAGRWAHGFVAYEAAAALDPALRVPCADPSLPLVRLVLTGPPRRVPVVRRGGAYALEPWRVGITAAHWERDVQTVRQAIGRGEVYLVNLTTRIDTRATGDLAALYADLAHAQGGSWCALLDLGSHVLVSASPELLLQRTGDLLLTRPMKGTARRHADAAGDRAAAQALRADPKERAENVMVVDLLRNDLSRVAVTGSVQVPSLLAVERYGTVWQLTSDVTATALPGAGLLEVFAAVLPSGSVTGAPRPAAMALVAALEPRPRGAYCGALGWAGQGHWRWSVGIRTVQVQAATGAAVYGTGCGITWSSDPAREYQELLDKAAVLPAAQAVQG